MTANDKMISKLNCLLTPNTPAKQVMTSGVVEPQTTGLLTMTAGWLSSTEKRTKPTRASSSLGLLEASF